MAYALIRDSILDFSIKPGQQICIKQLSDIAKISTTPLREALFGLEKDGYVGKNRNGSFHAEYINQYYVEKLFEYGFLLCSYAIEDYSRFLIDTYGMEIRSLIQYLGPRPGMTSLYQHVCSGSGNPFVSAQVSIIIFKSDAIKNALRCIKNDIYNEVYSVDSLIKGASLPEVLRMMYAKEIKYASEIANCVLFYAISKKGILDVG